MNSAKSTSFLLKFFVSGVLFMACNNAEKPPVAVIVQSPEEMQEKMKAILQNAAQFAVENEGKIDDSITLQQSSLIRLAYEKEDFQTLWSVKGKWHQSGDSLLNFIEHARLFGLFPQDYHFDQLTSLKKRFLEDSLGKTDRMDAALWSRADLMLTDAFFLLVHDIKLGRLPNDSVTLRKDSTISDDFYLSQLSSIRNLLSLSTEMRKLEPVHEGYHALKAGIKKFLDSADYRDLTIVPSRLKDPEGFKTALQKRLYEGGYIAFDSTAADSMQLADAVKKFQQRHGIAVDGKAGDGTLRMLNMSDRERFVRIAITMDRYKLLPEKMPDRYVWVNLPGYYMQLRENDTIKISSKIICGRPLTRTPLLTSAISELVTYPQWTIPTSIIVKEILPAVKKNPGYLEKKGFSLIDANGDEVDPYTVEWSKYNKGIPYRVVQGSGDDNALGIMKFNFNNKYAVYLHDTNQRYLFGQATRSLSHGCVRVQDWEKLAYYIIRYDNKKYADAKKKSPTEDSVITWLDRKEKHSIPVRNRLPVYLRYFTCEGKDQRIIFYDDVYGEDKALRERYFAAK
jgi:murein L,D-transpeptidase YcbB/YkuD